MGKRVFNTPVSEKIKLLGQLAVPGLMKALRINMDDKVVSDFFSNLMSQTFEYRKRTGEKRNDFVDLLLQLKEKGSVDYDIADQEELESEISESDNTESIKLGNNSF
jgi:cytochrome P450 family 6